jgi:predicted RNase H-like nuclease|tara:strand:+ start:5163 stop:5531 length:369 start_codon:yes stop_codon:yes gene_type:complete
MSMRSTAVEQLTAALPNTWTVIDDERALNVITRPTMLVSVRSFTPSDFAPLSKITVTMALMILSSHTDARAAEDDLDTLIVEALTAVNSLQNLTWTDANKMVHLDRYMGYEITTQATAELGD